MDKSISFKALDNKLKLTDSTITTLKKISISVESLINKFKSLNYQDSNLTNIPDATFLINTLQDLIDLTKDNQKFINDYDYKEIKMLSEELESYQKNKNDILRKINQKNFFQYGDNTLVVLEGFNGDYLEKQKCVCEYLVIYEPLFNTITRDIIETFGKIMGSKDYRLNSTTKENTYISLLNETYLFKGKYMQHYTSESTTTKLPINELFTNSASIIEYLNSVINYKGYLNASFVKLINDSQDDVIKITNDLLTSLKQNPEIINEFNKLNILIFIEGYIKVNLIINLCFKELFTDVKNLKTIIDLM